MEGDSPFDMFVWLDCVHSFAENYVPVLKRIQFSIQAAQGPNRHWGILESPPSELSSYALP